MTAPGGDGRSLPAAVLVGLLAVWELIVRAGGVDPLLLPAPTHVAESLWEDRAMLAPDLLVTGWEALAGLAAAIVARRGDRRRDAPLAARSTARCGRSWSARRRCRSRSSRR